MAQARSNIPTITEKVSQAHVGDPKVRAYAYSEYVGRKPGYVSSNPRAGAEWGALANVLDDFYKSSTRAYTQYKETQLESDISLGRVRADFAKETYGEQANRMSFKELVEKHPEFANDNPWVGVGYEQARLRELGMEAKSGLNKYLDEIGAFNAEDPAVFQQGVNTYFKEFREQAGLSSYDDKILVSKWFSPVEAEARKQVTAQYDAVIRNGRQDKLANQTSSNIATHIRLAIEEGRPIDFQSVGAELKLAAGNGLLNVKIPEVALNGLRVAYAQTEDRDVLELVKNVEVNGVKLIDTPAGAKWYEAEIDTINAKATKRSKKEEGDDAKFYGPDGSSLTHYYAYNMGSEKFPTQEAVIADYEKRTGINLNLAQEHALISDIRKIRNESIKNSNAFANAGNNPRIIAEAKNGIILSSASASEASSRFWKMYDDTGIEEYKKTAEALMDKEGDAHWQAVKDTSKKADEALKGYAEDIVKAFVAGASANVWNKNRLIDDIYERVKNEYMELYASNLTRLTEESTSSKTQVSSAVLSATASAEALNTIKEKVGAQYYTAGIDPTKYAKDARTMSKYNASIPPEFAKSEPDVQARVMWTDNTDGFLLSPKNIGIRKTQISSLANMLDVARMAGDNVSISKPEDVLPYIIYNPTEPVSGSMLLGGKMVFQLSQPVDQDVMNSLEARMRILFPNVSGFDYVVSVQAKATQSEDTSYQDADENEDPN